TVMYFTGIDPYTNEKLYVAKSRQESERQLKYFFWYKPEMKNDLLKSLMRAGRKDLADKIFGKRK
ncbi:MAG: YgiQ family radical SAM protein, partial [Bacteroidales bacterium]|nr:YgiQ family radical SAM protein [Bacteroidales bacterium]